MKSTTKYGILALIVVIVIIGGAYYLHSSNGPAAPAPSATATSTPTNVKSFVLTVQKRKVVSGETTLVAKQGDTVSITITADESDELHLHGYNKHVDFATNTPATITLVADQTGRFPFEMEGSKTDLGELDVEP